MERQIKNPPLEATGPVWDDLYVKKRIPWLSGGLSVNTEHFLSTFARGKKLLELGCGTGMDAGKLAKLGFDYLGLDISDAAIIDAQRRTDAKKISFVSADFFRWRGTGFDVVYDKGFFHNLAGPRRRNAFIRRVASLLNPNGIWISICGAADHRREDFCHGAIYLRDLVGPTEVYFEVLEVLKGPYGLAKKELDFEAWYGAFRRR